MLAEIAHLNDDYKKFYEQFVRGNSVDGVEIDDVMRSNTSKPGDERINFKEYVDRMKEGQNDVYDIMGKSIAVASSSSLLENLRKNGQEILYVADPVDEYAVQLLKDFDGTKLKLTMKEGLDFGDQDEKKTLKERKQCCTAEQIVVLVPRVMEKNIKVAQHGPQERVQSNTSIDVIGQQTRQQHKQRATTQKAQEEERESEGRVVREGNGQGERERGERKKERNGEGERGPSKQEEKRREERESVRKGERGKKEEGREAEKERETEVKKDVTDWTVVTRKKRRNTVQIFVKVDGSKVTPMEVSLSDDKVEDVLRQVQNDEDVYVTMHERMLKKSERLKSCGVTDGCTIQVTSRMRGGSKHKDKKSKVEKKQVTRQEPVRNEGLAVLEGEKEADGLCAMVCEQMRWAMETVNTLQSTDEDKRRIAEEVGKVKKAMAGMEKQATGGDLQGRRDR